MIRLFCGGSFGFDCRDSGWREQAQSDWRAVLLGDVDRFLERSGEVVVLPGVSYVGPFYFESDGMLDHDIVAAELEMLRSCTDAVFLLSDGLCPGTVAELCAANHMGKRVHVFYLVAGEGDETESSLRTPCWYPIIQSQLLNPLTYVHPCASEAEAVEGIVRLVQGWRASG